MNKQGFFGLVAGVVLALALLLGGRFVADHVRWVPSPAKPDPAPTPSKPAPKPAWPSVSSLLFPRWHSLDHA